jgi:hypothetical protein
MDFVLCRTYLDSLPSSWTTKRMFLYNYTRIFPIIYSMHDSGLCCACEVCATFNRIDDSAARIHAAGTGTTLQGRLPPTVAQTIVHPLIPHNIMLFPAGYAMLRLYAASSLPRGHPFAKTPIETQHPLWECAIRYRCLRHRCCSRVALFLLTRTTITAVHRGFIV